MRDRKSGVYSCHRRHKPIRTTDLVCACLQLVYLFTFHGESDDSMARLPPCHDLFPSGAAKRRAHKPFTATRTIESAHSLLIREYLTKRSSRDNCCASGSIRASRLVEAMQKWGCAEILTVRDSWYF